MSTVQKLATFYAKFWYQLPDSTWAISDNAPMNLRQFLNRLPETTGRSLVHEALCTLSIPEATAVPDVRVLLVLLATHAAVIERCDALLASRQPPKTLGTLLRSAYLAEVSEIKTLVKTFIQTELAKYD